MTKYLKCLWIEEQGQNLPEFALLLFLVCLTAVSAMGEVATKVDSMYSNVSTHVVAAGNPALTGGSAGYSTSAFANPALDQKNGKKQTPVYPSR